MVGDQVVIGDGTFASYVTLVCTYCNKLGICGNIDSVGVDTLGVIGDILSVGAEADIFCGNRFVLVSIITQ